MPETLVYHTTPPALLPMYGRTLLPKQKQTGGDVSIPELLPACLASVLPARTSSATSRSVASRQVVICPLPGPMCWLFHCT